MRLGYIETETICGVCRQHETSHVGRARACFGGYGTVFSPHGKPDYRVIHSTCPDCERDTPCSRHKEQLSR